MPASKKRSRPRRRTPAFTPTWASAISKRAESPRRSLNSGKPCASIPARRAPITIWERCCCGNGTTTRPRRHFETALGLKPNFAEAHNNLGIVHFTGGRYEDAIRSYRDALAAQAENVEARYNLARALTAVHRLDEALASYQEALRLRPSDADIHASTASALATLGRVDESVAHYRLALASNPNLAAALVDLAWILATSDRVGRAPDEAVRLAERAARLATEPDATILDTLAAAYFSAGQVARAAETAQAAVKAAIKAGNKELADRITGRLRLYVQQSR